MLQRCIKSLRTVAETESKEFYVIAMEEGSNSLYATAPFKGTVITLNWLTVSIALFGLNLR